MSIFILLYCGTETDSLRATGNNEQMAESLGINTNTMKLISSMIVCGLVVGLSEEVICIVWSNNWCLRVGTGAIVIALASIVITFG